MQQNAFLLRFSPLKYIFELDAWACCPWLFRDEFMKKGLFGAFGLSLAAIIGMQATTAYAAEKAGEKAADFSWSNVSMGGGGFVSAVIASPVDKGLFYARTDVGGAYRWNESTARWESMMDWVDVSERGLLGIEAIAVDPQESGVVYMVAGTSYWNNGRTAFLRSSDKGESWDVLYTWDEDGTKGAKVARCSTAPRTRASGNRRIMERAGAM